MTALRMALLSSALLGLALVQASCSFDPYCVTCADNDASIPDARLFDGGAGDEDALTDADPADACVPSGLEVCDGIDNDCNGAIDDGDLSGIGAPCSTDVGECTAGVTECDEGMITCSGQLPSIEICDTLDNDCNGDPDNGNPGGGAFCGTDVGECTSGITTCLAGDVSCQGNYDGTDELCNGLDDDCDNEYDEDIADGGSCGPATDTGPCEFGVLQCVGGQMQCVGAVHAALEQCDATDHDCDGNPTNGFDLENDPFNCGACGYACADEVTAGDPQIDLLVCNEGACLIAVCEDGYWDNNNTAADGCEYGPCAYVSSTDACNLSDDDCDGEVDEDAVEPIDFCDPDGECADPPDSGTRLAPSCTAAGWVCDSDNPPTGGIVSTDGANHIVVETQCDGRDNDCDGVADENFPQLATICHGDGLGLCRKDGIYICNALGDDVECDIDPASGGIATAEECNGIDDNCDGIVDNPDPADPDRVVDDMVHITHTVPDYYIYRYEASRPDATDTDGGLADARACSNADVLPWRGVTFAAAAAACAVSGKRLCTSVELEAACGGAAGNYYPYGGTFSDAVCNTEPFDGDPGDPDDDDLLLPTGGTLLSTCVSADNVYDLSGNLKEWSDEITGQTGGGVDIAVLRGGAYNTPAEGATCEFRTSRAPVNTVLPTVGFRCCSDTAP